MNRFMTISIASTLVLGSIAGTAFAAAHERDHGKEPAVSSHDGFLSDDPSTPAFYSMDYSQASNAQTDHIIRRWKGGPVEIVPVENLNDTSMKASLEHRQASEPRQVASLKSAIEHNPKLANRLEHRNIPIGSVVDAQTAADGGITFYVR